MRGNHSLTMKTWIVSFILIISFFVFPVLADNETTMSISVPSSIVSATETFTVGVYCVPSQAIKSYECGISFNPSLLQANSVSIGNIFNGHSLFTNNGSIDNTNGSINLIYGLIMGSGNVTDPGYFINISFTAKGTSGTSAINLVDAGVTNETSYVPLSISNGSVQIDATAPTISDQSQSSGTTGDSFVFNVSVSDNVDDADELSVYVDWDHDSLGSNNSMSYAGGSYFTKTVTLDSDSTSAMTYKIYIADTYGNSRTSSLSSVSVSDNDQPILVSDTSQSSGSTGDQYYWYVNASDNVDSESALTMKIVWSHGSLSGNASMTYSGSYWTYHHALDNAISTMTYKIYIEDDAGNSLFTTGSESPVSVSDNDNPSISSIQATPSSQVSNGAVNVSATITDNVALQNIFVKITYPDSSYINDSIISNQSGNTYFCSKTYSDLGTYNYEFYAVDTSNNKLTSSPYTFSITDASAPQISDVSISNSDPLDTNSSYGWTNITCTVSDDELNLVKLVISNPNSSITNTSMIMKSSGHYYLNTTLTNPGNYSYYIWVNDSSNNQNTTSSSSVSIPPNWDINNDGNTTVFDLILISNHYNETGNDGWIREDVDNTGEIKVLDIVITANHYGDSWW